MWGTVRLRVCWARVLHWLTWLYPRWVQVLSGCVSGAVGAAIASPTDLIKVRLQASTGVAYNSISQAVTSIVAADGVRGLWRGVVPTGGCATAWQGGGICPVLGRVVPGPWLWEGVEGFNQLGPVFPPWCSTTGGDSDRGSSWHVRPRQALHHRSGLAV
jgi:hypothetical protein